MRRHLTDSHDKAMTDHFANGTAYRRGRERRRCQSWNRSLAQVSGRIIRQRPITANSSAMRQSGDIGLPDKQARHPQDDGVRCVYDG